MEVKSMTLEQLQDLVLELKPQVEALTADKEALTAELAETRETNLMLQKRNNELFTRIAQGTTEVEEEEEEEVETCEDFSKRMLGDIFRR